MKFVGALKKAFGGIVLVFSVSLLPVSFAEMDKDKSLHFGVSAGLGFTGYALTDSRGVSYSGCLAVGLGKELYDIDRSDDGFSEADLIADLAGCVVGVEFAEYLEGYQITPSIKSNFVGIKVSIPLR